MPSRDGRARSARGVGVGRVGPSPRRGRSGSGGQSPPSPTRSWEPLLAATTANATATVSVTVTVTATAPAYPSRIPPRLRSAPATFSAKALRSSLGRAR